MNATTVPALCRPTPSDPQSDPMAPDFNGRSRTAVDDHRRSAALAWTPSVDLDTCARNSLSAGSGFESLGAYCETVLLRRGCSDRQLLREGESDGHLPMPMTFLIHLCGAAALAGDGVRRLAW